jgi:hypothetical protein
MKNSYPIDTAETPQSNHDFLESYGIDLKKIYNYITYDSSGKLVASYTDIDSMAKRVNPLFGQDGKIQVDQSIFENGEFTDLRRNRLKALIMIWLSIKCPEVLLTVNYNPSFNATDVREEFKFGLFTRHGYLIPKNILDIITKLEQNNSESSLVDAICKVLTFDNPEWLRPDDSEANKALIDAIDQYIDACFKLQELEYLMH